MTEYIILGTIQGIAEWLPVSSEGLLVLAQVNLFGSEDPLTELIKISLFLHMGTFLAAFLYFRRDVKNLSLVLLNYLTKKNGLEKNNDIKILKFLITATATTGAIGATLLFGLQALENQTFLNFGIEVGGRGAMGFVGFLLLITGLLQIQTSKNKTAKIKKVRDIKPADAIILGVMQGFAILPGLSRSGLTIAGLLLRKFDDTTALRLSFLMSLPVILAGNIFLNADKFTLNAGFLFGLLASFFFGLVTIHALLKFAGRINFGYFVLIFGILAIAGIFV